MRRAATEERKEKRRERPAQGRGNEHDGAMTRQTLGMRPRDRDSIRKAANTLADAFDVLGLESLNITRIAAKRWLKIEAAVLHCGDSPRTR